MAGGKEAALVSQRSTRGKVVLAALASTPAAGAAAFACGCLPAGNSGGTADHRHAAGKRTPPEFTTNMLIHEARLNFQLVKFADEEPLTTPKRLLAYLAEGLAAEADETFWLVCMNPGRRPICRLRLRGGPLVAAMVSMRDVARVVVLTEARAIACLRTPGAGPVRPGPADARLVANLHDTGKLLQVELADYLIARLDDSHYYSWFEHRMRMT
jgi:DNA repair protein RadC